MPEATNPFIKGFTDKIPADEETEESQPWLLTNLDNQDDDKPSVDNGRMHATVQLEELPNGRQSGQSTKEVPAPKTGGVVYKVEDVPPWYLCLILGLQHYLTMFGGTISYPYILTPKLCMRDDDPARGYIISTTFFVSGIATFLQSSFGSRLPIIQGSTFTFLIPTLAILSLPQWQCPTDQQIMAGRGLVNGRNQTHPVTEEEYTHLWQVRMLEVQGAVIVASMFEVFIGITGLIGLVLRFITPISVTPIITLIGLSLFEDASRAAGKHWGIAIMTILMLIIFSEYLRETDIPRLTYSRANGIGWKRFPLFKLFPVLLTIVLSWLFCAILTATDVFEEKSPARTDVRLQALHNSPWFRVPYPGQWGLPTVSAGAVFGIMAGVVSSAIESVGDYYACARMCGAPPPPTHAINRGIFMEGIGCVLSGIWGSGNGLTSYSENIGAIGVTKVGSRRVIQYGAVLMIFFGTMGKFGALFVTMPEPILGGIFCVMFAVISGVGLTNLQFVDLNSTRNLFILGISIFTGLMVPKYMGTNPGILNTGSDFLDQILTVLLSTSLFVGGLIAIIMDNTMKGTDEERGLKKWRESEMTSGPISVENRRELNKCYEFPVGMGVVRRITFLKYLPISPTFDDKFVGEKIGNKCRKVFARLRRRPTDSPKDEVATTKA